MSPPKTRNVPAASTTVVVAAVAAVAAVLAVCARRVERTAVAGTSMVPTLLPGDRLLVWRGTTYRPGDLVVVAGRGPETGDAVKRARTVDEEGVVVAGDNPAASTDSRHYGPVPLADLRGRVVYRYAPASRVGRTSARRPRRAAG